MIVSGCTSITDDAQYKPITKHAGWFYGACLVINMPNLPKGTPVTLVDAEGTENRFRSEIIAPTKNPDKCLPLHEETSGGNNIGGNRFYLISKPEKGKFDTTFTYGIAVVLEKNNRALSISETLDLNNDGKIDLFSVCAASEGINFDIWSSTPYKSINLWNGYYYLGYGIESDCPER
ncbi:hypothetical protein GAB14E_2473 [Colwellia psychrerythraea]|uniref:Uncharacterized protein n=2 Tax=Colwellia psychrerythraea TaxID=28229 RepID=A0A099KW83_COLPS|nr:hypothetical protein GAB14E_2473 [Colwellia psychrerythraea]